jgi:hypothetical protein
MTQKVVAGQPLKIRADTFNSMIDAANYVKNKRTGNSVDIKRTNSGLILIRNDTESDVAIRRVMGFGDTVADPATAEDQFCEYIAFKGATPDIDLHVGKWALLLDPIGSGEYGRAAISGEHQAKINVTDESHTHVEIGDESTLLQSCFYGSAKILWKESGTGEKWAVIRLGYVSEGVYLCQATADESGGEITGKVLDATLTKVGSNITFITESQGS